MKSFSLCGFLLLLSILAFGQDKKVPAEGEGTVNEWEGPQTERVLPKGISYTELELWGDGLDTESIRRVDCNANGRIKEESTFRYDMHTHNPGIKARITPISGIYKTVYEHDSNGNVIHKKMYEEIPVNSRGGVQKIRMLASGNTEKDINAFTDSVIASKPEPFYTLYSDEFCSYDENNNPLLRNDTVKHHVERYSYTYNANDKVATQKKLDLFYNAAGKYFYNTRLRSFSYDSAGRILSILQYDLANDTVTDALTNGVLHVRKYFHYNEKGLPDTITYVPGISYQHIIAYNSKDLISNYTIIKREQQWQDTVWYYSYQYTGNDLTEMDHCEHGLKTQPTHVLYSYNKRHQLIEMRTYRPGSRKKGQPYVQLLYFYGDKTEDAVTAKHSLYIPPAKRNKNIRPATAEKQKGEARKPDIHTPAKATGREQIFTYVEQMPTFPGDINAYIKAHLTYPAAAKKAQLEGRVILRFVVNSDGTLSNYEVQRGLGYGCDEAALKMLKSMSKWKPGTQNGKAVAVYYTLPVYFKTN